MGSRARYRDCRRRRAGLPLSDSRPQELVEYADDERLRDERGLARDLEGDVGSDRGVSAFDGAERGLQREVSRGVVAFEHAAARAGLALGAVECCGCVGDGALDSQDGGWWQMARRLSRVTAERHFVRPRGC